MKYIPISVLLLAFSSCKLRDDKKNTNFRDEEGVQQKLIQSILGSDRQASEFEADLWGGPFTLNRQTFLKNHPGHIFYSQLWNFDVADSVGGAILSFIHNDYPQDSFVELICTADQISILENEKQAFLQDDYIVLFTIDKITRAAASLENGDSRDEAPIFSETQAFIAKGKLVKLLKLPQAEQHKR